ncbi:MAG: hypothetical protein A3G76_02265 [Acidobacteria bacterium RIFCSPLOWO2_12_FULL_65_11]|nr:MAG: hypothetical protein A3H95_13310 [Acidobacteria bacterium RIFCSPLOWO2_02_FULL_64_15]OFW31623.1 MAG: hypothetical protein A3G76_02265 [Acidobacteria bacterium RIFCSPLOWO2_12_FULL_65_11]
MSRRRLGISLSTVALAIWVVSLSAATGGGLSLINDRDLKDWLSYIASDEVEGRAVFTTGIGLAAGYIEDHMRAVGANPAGDAGSYLQTVRVLGVKATSRSTVTVEIDGETRTFADGQGVTFPRNAGGKRSVAIDRVEFAGYGLDAPGANHMNFRGKDVKGAAVIWLGTSGPRSLDAQYRRLLTGRNRYAIEDLKAAASIGAQAPAGGRGGQPPADGAAASGAPGAGAQGAGAGAQAAGQGRGNQIPAADFTTVQRLDSLLPPSVTANDAFFEFLFSRAPTKYAELKRIAEAQEPLPSFRLDGVKLTFNVDADYEVVRTRLTKNVVAIVEGSDPQLKDTYVVFGAHYDHVGYAEGEVTPGPNGTRRLGAPGRVTPGAEGDRIWNGADDDGSGIVAVMALAKAFAQGPRPKRSLLFIWHSGEESGLWGSRYFADHPTVPIDRIVAALNIDMVGRNRDDKSSEENTVYLVGSDRISTELHEINRGANEELPRPLTLNYEFNDPSDLEQLYTRSDHYSYASKGIPVIFFTTGLHPDYHANTDHVSKIEFDKLTRVVQLAYETGWRVANLDRAPVRDNKGPRAGKATR